MRLQDRFPTAAKVGAEIVELNTDFRVGLKIMQAFEDKNLTSFEKQAVMCGLLFKKIPEDYGDALAVAKKFLDCGETRYEKPDGPRVYSFTKDAKYIYSAFLQTYGVDLQTAEMHWWKFCYMFWDLSENTAFSQIVSLRDRQARGKLTKEERQLCIRLHSVLSLEEEEEDQELKEARENFERLLRG